MTRRIGTATMLLFACLSSGAWAALLPTDLAPKVGADYQPVDADEVAIWQSLARLEEAIRNSPQRLVSPPLDAYMHGVVERLLGGHAPELRVYVLHDASLNAAMLPSGMMIVHTGLLARVRSEAQLAAVLAHEAGHYFRRHALDLHRDLRRNAALAESAKAALLSYEDPESNGAWSLINQAIIMSSPRFSRDMESEADAYGLMLMTRAGYSPRAASAIWNQVIDERRASAAERHASYRDGTNSAMSTHPPTEARLLDLSATADYLAARRSAPGDDGRDEWADVVRPYQAMLLQEQVYLNDPGASLYLLENLAKDGWTASLRFDEGEIYRLRNASGDDRKAAAAYAAATAFADAPPEAWRAHGFALLGAGSRPAGVEALTRYLAMKPDAPDAAMIRFIIADDRREIADANRASRSDMTVKAGPEWKRVLASREPSRRIDVWSWLDPQVDRVTVIRGLPEGKTIVSQRTNADQRVPVFRAGMTTQDLVSMVEVSYRVNGVSMFDIESVEPFDFLGGAGVRLRYDYASGIAFRKKGACVMRIVDGKLYAMKLESLAGKPFDTVAPEFDRLVGSAELGR